MSGIAAAFGMGAGAPSGEELAVITRGMISAFARPKDDGIDFWRGASVAMGQVWYATTPEDVARGPHVGQRGALRAVGDVRIDNRDDVAASLRMSARTADLDIFLAAWEKWGEQAILQVVGDYALAIWDGARGALSLMRDAMGARSLYLARAAGLVIAASELHALGASGHVGFELEPAQAARFLVHRYSGTDGTLFKGIEAVPAGGVIRLSERGETRSQVWSPDPYARLSGSPESCADQVGDVLEKAVSARLRSVGTVAITVSGGVDSSSVACLAALGSQSRAQLPTLAHLSYVGTGADEGEYFRTIVEHTGCPSITVDPREHAEATLPSAWRMPFELYDIVTSNYGVLLGALPSPERSVLQTGFGGDDLLGATNQDFPDFIRAQKWAEAWYVARRMGGSRRNALSFALRQFGR